MKLLGWELRRVRDRRTARQRAYAAAKINRLTSGWVTQPLTEDAELRRSLKTLRARSRELAENNDYLQKFLSLLDANVVGPRGIVLQNKSVRETTGEFDTPVNDAVEAAWEQWGQMANASVEGMRSWLDLQRLILRCLAMDGEVLVRKVTGADNPFRFALQVIEADHLDENHHEDLPNGNRIIMGVEVNRWRKPVAYHLLTQHPGEYSYRTSTGKLRDRVPADELLHVFMAHRPTQTRGVPWAHTAMLRLTMLGGYEEAALVGARAGACQMGFIESEDGEGYTGDDKDEDGSIIHEAESGIFHQLPRGMKVSPFTPNQPDGELPFFVKAMLRGVASGVNVSYNSLGSDLEGVNYSSIRQGVMDERDYWRVVQTWLIEHLHGPIFSAWFPMAVLSGQLVIAPSKSARAMAPTWQPRGWDWVDPLKDMTANLSALRASLTTRQEIVAKQGKDLEDVFKQLAAEEELAKRYGLTLTTEPPAATPTKQEDEDGEDEDQDSDPADANADADARQAGAQFPHYAGNGGRHGAHRRVVV